VAKLPAEGMRLSFSAVVCSELLLQRRMPVGGASLAVVEGTMPVSLQRERACNSPGAIASLASATA
jgi:hypothetical protein